MQRGVRVRGRGRGVSGGRRGNCDSSSALGATHASEDVKPAILLRNTRGQSQSSSLNGHSSSYQITDELLNRSSTTTTTAKVGTRDKFSSLPPGSSITLANHSREFSIQEAERVLRERDIPTTVAGASVARLDVYSEAQAFLVVGLVDWATPTSSSRNNHLSLLNRLIGCHTTEPHIDNKSLIRLSMSIDHRVLVLSLTSATVNGVVDRDSLAVSHALSFLFAACHCVILMENASSPLTSSENSVGNAGFESNEGLMERLQRIPSALRLSRRTARIIISSQIAAAQVRSKMQSPAPAPATLFIAFNGCVWSELIPTARTRTFRSIAKVLREESSETQLGSLRIIFIPCDDSCNGGILEGDNNTYDGNCASNSGLSTIKGDPWQAVLEREIKPYVTTLGSPVNDTINSFISLIRSHPRWPVCQGSSTVTVSAIASMASSLSSNLFGTPTIADRTVTSLSPSVVPTPINGRQNRRRKGELSNRARSRGSASAWLASCSRINSVPSSLGIVTERGWLRFASLVWESLC